MNKIKESYNFLCDKVSKLLPKSFSDKKKKIISTVALAALALLALSFIVLPPIGLIYGIVVGGTGVKVACSFGLALYLSSTLTPTRVRS